MKPKIKWSVFACSILLAGNVYAEYYVSYQDCPRVEYCCNGCQYSYSRSGCSQAVINIVSHSPYRHASRGSEQVAEYAWISAP